MDYNTINNRIDSKFYTVTEPPPNRKLYKDTYIFDENQTVVWNRNKVKQENANLQNEIQLYYDNVNEKSKQFKLDCITYVKCELNLDASVSNEFFEYVYSKYHAYGFHEVLDELSDLILLYKRINSIG